MQGQYCFLQKNPSAGSVRLKTADKNGYYATEYANGDGAILFVCGVGTALFAQRLHDVTLCGLDENAEYTYTLGGRRYTKSGAYLMNKGIVIDDWNPLSSVIVEFEKV